MRAHTRKSLLLVESVAHAQSSREQEEVAVDFWGRRRRALEAFVHSQPFTLTISATILVNAVYIALETDLRADGDGSALWYLVELAFTLVFLVELLLRLAAVDNVQAFSASGWNVLDMVLVVISCVDTFILSTSQLSVAGTIRMIRLVRLVRLVRLFRFFHELWVLIAGMMEAMWTLVWTWFLMFLLVYVFGIFVTRVTGHRYRDDRDIEEYFGDLPRSMFTLFQVTTTEGWADIARSTMKHQPWMWAFFVLYLFVTTYATMNVVVAVIVENTVDQVGGMRAKYAERQAHQQQAACAQLYDVFIRADKDGDGALTKEEFLGALEEEVKTHLHLLGIDERQAENLFGLLDHDSSGSLDAQEFVGGVARASGMARAKDVLAVQCDLWRSEEKVRERLRQITSRCEQQMDVIEKSVKDLRQEVQLITSTLAHPHWRDQNAPCGP